MNDEFSSAEECEQAFYEAFNAADVELMARVWAAQSAVICVHPGGEALRGLQEVMESWRQIFAGAAPVRFELSDHDIIEDAQVCVRHVHENIHHGPDMSAMAVVLATNVFVRENSGWKLRSHHASAAPVREAARPATRSTVH